MSQNNVKKHSRYLSIEEIDTNSKKKFRITSPRSLSVMKKLGVSNSELHFVTYKQFLKQHPDLFGEKKDITKVGYEFYESNRKEIINKIKKLREKEKNESLKSNSQTIQNNNNDNQKSIEVVKSTAIENEEKAFERMKNKNEKDLIGMVQYELKREIMKKQAEEQLKD